MPHIPVWYAVDSDCSSTMGIQSEARLRNAGILNDYDLKEETIPAPIEPKIPEPDRRRGGKGGKKEEKPPKEPEVEQPEKECEATWLNTKGVNFTIVTTMVAPEMLEISRNA